MLWLLAACAACVIFGAAALGTFVPLRNTGGIEYLFAGPPPLTLLAAAVLSVTALTALYLIVNDIAQRRAPDRTGFAKSGRWLSPIAALSVVALGVVPAMPGVGEVGAPLAYYFYDLRWWWFASLVFLLVVNVDHLTGQRLAGLIGYLSAWSIPGHRWLIDLTLFLLVMLWAVVTTPTLRFSGSLTGDEPKYLRYCELWYQGGGFDISAKKLLTELPSDHPPATLAIAGLLVRSLAEDAAALASDLRAFARDPFGFRWNRAKGDDGFLTGKQGGVYQLYQPGLSAVLFPGYVVDRYLLNSGPGYQNEFPADLIMTNVMMLLVYAACAVAMFRLLRHALGSDGLAGLWAAVALLTLPTTAFAFQFYPETPALLIILIVSTVVLFRAERTTPLAAAAAGGAAASLAWLHPRFLLVSLLLGALGAVRIRDRSRRVFILAWCALLLSLTAFDYHVTGSASPTALWDATTSSTFNPWGVPSNLLGYAIHRVSGVNTSGRCAMRA
jgi:hypothetical protein